MKKSIPFSLALVLLSLMIFPTAQEPDVLHWNGKKYEIHSNPLEIYLEKYPEKRPRSGSRTTANWRGYVATWEIKNGKLVLKDIEITVAVQRPDKEYDYKQKSVLQEVFPGGREVVVDWFKGNIIIPEGEMREYVHMGYGSLYEKYIILKIVNGEMKDARNLTLDGFKEFRKAQFAAFKKTEEYSQALANLKKNRGQEQGDDAFLESFMFEYYSEKYMSMIFDDEK